MANATVGVLRVLLTANAAEFEAVMLRSAKTAQTWSKDLRSFGQQATQVGQSLTKALTIPILGLGAGAIKAASDFESSFAGVRKTVDATEPEFAKLAQGLRNMAKEVPANVNELNKVAEAAGQLGIRKDDILQFTRTMADLGVATNLTADEAATATAQFQNIFGAAGKDVDRFGATLVALGNAGASTEKDIIDMGLRIAGAGHQVGLTQAQVMAFASALSSVGINAEAGGSAISRVFLKINDAVAAGGSKLAEFARIAGMSSGEFKEAFETNAAQATTAFIGGLARLKSEGENVNATLENVVGKNIILKDTLLRASGAGQLLTDQIKLAESAWQDNNALTKEAAERYKTFASQSQLLWNELRDVGITLGTALLPVMRDLLAVAKPVIQAAGEMVDWFSKLPEPVRQVSVGMLAMFAAIGPSIWMLGEVATAGSAIFKAYSSIIAGDLLGKVALGFRGIGAAAVAAAPTMLAIAAAVAAVSAAYTRFSDDGTSVVATIDQLTEAERAEYAVQQRMGQGWEYLVKKQKEKAESLDSLGSRTLTTAGAYVEFKGAVDQASTSMRTGAAATRELTEEQLKHEAAIKSLRASLFGADDIQRAHDYLEALGGVQNVSKMTTEAKQELHAAVQRALDAYKALGQQAPAALQQVYAATLPLLNNQLERAFLPFKAAILDSKPVLDEVRASMAAMASIKFNTVWLPFIQGVKAISPLGKSIGGQMVAGVGAAIRTQLGPTIMAALQGGGSVSKSIGGLIGGSLFGEEAMKGITKSLTGSFLGKTLGGALASVLPGIGTMLGSAVGGLVGKGLGKLFGGGEGKKVNDLRDKFTDAAGGIHELNVKAKEAGLTLDRFLRAKTVKEYEAAVAELEAAFAALEEQTRQNQEAANTLFDDIMAAGADGVPAAMRETIERFIELGLLTDDQIAKLRGLGDSGALNIQKMDDALALFNGRVEALGPAYAQAKIDETSKKYINAIDYATKHGASLDQMLHDAKEELSALVVESLKSGTTLPANMKPWIESLAAQGKLLDEQGNKITDLSKINWGPEMKTEAQIAQEGWDKILAKIDELITKLTGPLETALDDVTRDRTFNITPKVGDVDTDDYTRDGSRLPRDPGHRVGTIGRWGTWFKNFGSGFSTTLHDIEAVVTPDQAPAFAMDVLSRLGGGFQSQSPATVSGPAKNSFFLISMPVDAMGDASRMTSEVFRQTRSALEIDREGVATAMDQWIRSMGYRRG
jgi:TP901 family phage tail tape measure protein